MVADLMPRIKRFLPGVGPREAALRTVAQMVIAVLLYRDRASILQAAASFRSATRRRPQQRASLWQEQARPQKLPQRFEGLADSVLALPDSRLERDCVVQAASRQSEPTDHARQYVKTAKKPNGNPFRTGQRRVMASRN
jgi:hypothetical protein